MSHPEGWPEKNVEYYNSLLYQKGVDRIAEFKLPELQLSNLEVYNVPRDHPAYPGRGVRVRHSVIKKEEDVGYYAGFYRPAMVAPNNGYLFDTYNKDKNMVVDAFLCGNETRFFNDVRGTHREANLVAVDASFALGTVTLWTIVFTAARDIQVGEELLINYQADGKERYWEPPEVIDLTAEPVHIKREPIEADDEFGHTPSQESTDRRLKKRERESEDDEGEKPGVMECYVCQLPLPDDGVTRKRNCPRRCRACRNAANLERRHKDPVAWLQHRWYNSAKRQWPDAQPSLWAKETVKEVYERCGGKSVLSGEEDVKMLCVSWKRKRYDVGELVLLTTKEAKSMAHLSEEDRLACFVQGEI